MDHNFLNQVQQTLENNLSDPNFGISQLCNHLSVSRTTLHRHIVALTKRSTSLYLRSLRLQKARELLEDGEMNVSEVAYKVGFRSPAYFSRCFQEEFGMPPIEVLKGVR